jgi:hypothetical protein
MHGREARFILTLVRKHGDKRLHGRPGCSWGDNYKMDLKEIGQESMEYIFLRTGTHGRLL